MLALGVFAAWLAALGFARLRTPLERLHAITFLNAVAGAALVAAAFITEGSSTRPWKSVLLWALLLLSGGLLAHATGRALLIRDAERQ